MTRRPPERARLAAFSVLIGLVFWDPPITGAASYSLNQAAEGQGLHAEHCRCDGGAWCGRPVDRPDCQSIGA